MEPAPHRVAHGLQSLAVAALTHWALAWLVVNGEWSVPDGSLLLAAGLMAILHHTLYRKPRTDTWLRFDGEQWSWSAIDDEAPRGSGALQVALRLGPWWLLRARAQRGCGGSEWIWLRPESVRAAAYGSVAPLPGQPSIDGTRLRTLLNWS